MSPVADPAVDGRDGYGLHDLLVLEKVVVLLVIRIELVVPGEAFTVYSWEYLHLSAFLHFFGPAM